MKTYEKTKEVCEFVNNAVYLAKSQGTLKEFEEYCGLSPGYFSRRKLGTQKAFSLQTAILVSEYLGRTIDELLNPKLRYDLEAKRMQDKMEMIEQQRLSMTEGVE